ncbi:MAG TPA: hypothetical protein VKW09_09020 [bacterium]|nr:hypothetical protein [bacterium]
MGIARSRWAAAIVAAVVMLVVAPGTMMFAWADHGHGGKETIGADKNGDVQGDKSSNDHRGSKGRGAGGDDKVKGVNGFSRSDYTGLEFHR